MNPVGALHAAFTADVLWRTATYTGPGRLTAAATLTSWTPDAPALAAVAGAAAWYLRAAARVRLSGTCWPRRRSAGFVAGLAVVVVSTCSFLGVYSSVLFSVFVIQVCLLLLAAPLLLGSGGPAALLRATRRRQPRRSRFASRTFAAARLPGVGPLLLIVVTAAVFFTPLMGAVLRHSWAMQLLQVCLVAAGLVMALPVTDDGVRLTSLAYAAMLGLAVVEFLIDAVPGIALRLSGAVLTPGYWLAVHRPWGPTPLQDQHTAGAWLWLFGEAGDLPFIAALLVAWVRSDAREAVATDRQLDLEAASAQAAGAPADTLTRPWWETDASVFGDDRARRSGWRTRE